MPQAKFTEAQKFSEEQLEALGQGYEVIEKIDPGSPAYKNMIAFLNRLPQPVLKQIAGAKIRWLSPLARNRIKED